MMDKVALFGGTFDPLHRGHLNLALEAVSDCGLDRLLFMPNYISPFKTGKSVTPGEQRLEMLRRVVRYDPAFGVTDYELGRAEPSYTYDTLTHFKEIYGNGMHFVLGFDSILTLETWYRGPDLLTEFSFITGRRPDTDDALGFRKIEEYREKYGAKIFCVDLEPFDASSTEIRWKTAMGEDISDLVPPEIEEYIHENNLYR
jgi:nicotinate-nucleotide adenylyltransferase